VGNIRVSDTSFESIEPFDMLAEKVQSVSAGRPVFNWTLVSLLDAGTFKESLKPLVHSVFKFRVDPSGTPGSTIKEMVG